MNRYRLIVSGASALTFALLIAGCGDYADPDPSSGGTAGSGTAGSTSGTGGSTAGTGGSAAGTGGSAAGTGGSAAGTAGSAAGTGGSAAGTGGSAAGTGGSAAGTAGSGGATAGAAGSAGSGGSGGGGGPVTCDDLAPCGGAVMGAYTVMSSCPLPITGNVDVRGLGLNQECEGAPAPVSGMMEITGTWTATGSDFLDETTTTGMAEFELVSACLVLSGTTTTCPNIGPPLRSAGFASVTCVDNAETGGCSCTGTINQEGGLGFIDPSRAEPEGTFTTMDNTLVTSVFGDETEYSYCVADNKLAMTLVNASKTGTVMGPIVLQKN